MSNIEIFIDTPEGKQKYEFSRDAFVIDPSDVENELCSVGAQMLDYGQIEAQLRAEVESKEAHIYSLELGLDSKIRHDHAEKGAKITEAKLTTMIKGHEDRITALQDLKSSRQNLNVMKWAMEALKSKRDCLLSLSYTQRQLMKADTY